MISIEFILLGLLAGVLSGLIGIGGGIIIVPILVFFFGFTQHTAQGTTIALMVPPIGILAAWSYYQKGFVDLKVATLVCLGFVVGGFLGARFATDLSTALLERIFGGVLMIIAVKMLFFR
jgi:uncharacterized membrane protein YfcA